MTGYSHGFAHKQTTHAAHLTHIGHHPTRAKCPSHGHHVHMPETHYDVSLADGSALFGDCGEAGTADAMCAAENARMVASSIGYNRRYSQRDEVLEPADACLHRGTCPPASASMFSQVHGCASARPTSPRQHSATTARRHGSPTRGYTPATHIRTTESPRSTANADNSFRDESPTYSAWSQIRPAERSPRKPTAHPHGFSVQTQEYVPSDHGFVREREHSASPPRARTQVEAPNSALPRCPRSNVVHREQLVSPRPQTPPTPLRGFGKLETMPQCVYEPVGEHVRRAHEHVSAAREYVTRAQEHVSAANQRANVRRVLAAHDEGPSTHEHRAPVRDYSHGTYVRAPPAYEHPAHRCERECHPEYVSESTSHDMKHVYYTANSPVGTRYAGPRMDDDTRVRVDASARLVRRGDVDLTPLLPCTFPARQSVASPMNGDTYHRTSVYAASGLPMDMPTYSSLREWTARLNDP